MSEQSGRVVRLIELEKLIPFEKHPFVVREDEQMKMLVNSIRDVGVLVPGIVRSLYEDLQLQMKRYLRRSNRIPMSVLAWKSPLEKRKEIEAAYDKPNRPVSHH